MASESIVQQGPDPIVRKITTVIDTATVILILFGILLLILARRRQVPIETKQGIDRRPLWRRVGRRMITGWFGWGPDTGKNLELIDEPEKNDKGR